MWIEIRHPKTGKLQFRYDPLRQLAEVQDRGDKQVIDLKQFQEAGPIKDPAGRLKPTVLADGPKDYV